MDGAIERFQPKDGVADGLTEPQRRAVVHGDGPLLVLAGPGSGKTRVITRRIASLIARGVPAWSILALTFTNKAAREMAERVESLVPADTPGRRGLTVSTFHSWCARLLRQFGPTSPAARHVTGPLESGFTILDAADARASAKKAVKAAGLDPKNFTPAWAMGYISEQKNRLRTATQCQEEAQDFVARTAAKVFLEYELILGRANALDFDDLLVRTAWMLIQDETVRSAVQDRFRHLLVDEYQDTNHAQFVIARMVAQKHGNICVVGDPDQSIYGWRGADISNILEFEEAWPGTAIVALGDNFRSTEPIVATADCLIRHNLARRERPLFSMVGAGEPVRRVGCGDDRDEARVVVQSMLDSLAAGTPCREMAVLYRMNALSRAIEEECLRRELPYVVARGTAFYERAEVRTILSYLRVLANPADDMALQRAAQNPSRGIGDSGFAKLSAYAAMHGTSVRAVLGKARAAGVAARTAKACEGFAAELDALSLRLSGAGWDANGTCRLGPFVMDLIEVSGLRIAVIKDSADEEEGDERSANLTEVANAAAETPVPVRPDAAADADAGTLALARAVDLTLMGALRAYLERVALVADADMVDPERGAVTLMSLHAAKGLEFDKVSIIGIEQGILPHERSLSHPDKLEEERRLLYVGISRARRDLTLSSAALRTRNGIRLPTIPSIFDQELPEDHLKREGNTGGCAGWGRGDIDDEPSGPVGSRTSPRALPGRRIVALGHADATAEPDGLGTGALVRHFQFGVGRVEAVFREGGRSKARVAFRTAGVRTLVLDFVKLQVIG
ncbi:MAG: UvrD-helicase domain-containing protein [Planctomycetota bacterium]|nr:UvrD-helicase domain-containing protein [Planctomycetota bacterium]MDA1105463.1 UvrD-helicase domain-containing protein [Planctomycetota bacterium]